MLGEIRPALLTATAPLPPPEIYEQEYEYWPWGKLIEWVAAWVCDHAPFGARLFDYMCGTGYLLARIREQRSDLFAEGCDIHWPFVEFATRKHAGIHVHHADALTLTQNGLPDVILCTAGLHHLDFIQQEVFLDKISDEAKAETIVIFGEEAIGDYFDEMSRRIAALMFDSQLIAYGLEKEWPAHMIEAAIDVMRNDILLRGEYKRSVSNWMNLIERRFYVLKVMFTWSANVGGDIVFVCTKSK